MILFIIISVILITLFFPYQDTQNMLNEQDFIMQSKLYYHEIIVNDLNSGKLLVTYEYFPSMHTGEISFYSNPILSTKLPISFTIIGIYSIQGGHWVKITNNSYNIVITNNPITISFNSSVEYTNVYIIINYGFTIFIPINSTV